MNHPDADYREGDHGDYPEKSLAEIQRAYDEFDDQETNRLLEWDGNSPI